MSPRFSRALCAFPVLFALLCTWRVRTATPGFAELCYLAALASGLGLMPALALTWSTLRSRLGLVLIVLSSLAGASAFAHELAQADGLRARAPVWLLYVLGFGAGSALCLGAQLHARLAERSRAARVEGALLALVVLGVLLGAAPQNRHVLLLLVLVTTMLLTTTLQVALAMAMPRLAWSAAGVALLAALALGRPEQTAAARTHAVVHDPQLAQLDAVLPRFGRAYRGLHVPERIARCPSPLDFEGARRLGLTKAQRRNVVIVTIDTLRVDEATSRTERGPLMPQLTRFFSGAIRARAAYTGYPATMMALGSAFSGLLPSHALLLPRPPVSIFGALRDHFDDVSAVLPRGRYFERPGVARYILQGAEHVKVAAKADQTAAALKRLTRLRRAQKRHLLWLHYFEPHEPYVQQPGFAFGSTPRARYRSELAALDVKLGRLFAAFERMHVADDTLVLVFSDHGESFGEHGHQHHHYHLYPWLVRVPFAMRVPGQPARELTGPVQLADVAATVLDFAGVKAAQPLDGISLLTSDPRPSRVIVSEEFPMPSSLLEHYGESTPDRDDLAQRITQIERGPGYPSKISIVRDDVQLVVHRTSNVSELYRFDRDPGVRDDLSGREPELTSALLGELARYQAGVSATLSCTQAE